MVDLLNQIGLEHYERLIRDNERMRTTLTNIASYADRSVFGSWRQRVYDMATGGLRGAEEPRRATYIAPNTFRLLRGGSPAPGDTGSFGTAWDREAKELGGWPSELCAKILRTLASAAGGPEGMTADQMGRIMRVPHGAGQVLGATSNMVNKMGRHWLAYGYSDGGGAGDRLWHITDRGRRILELMAQRDAGD